MKVLSYKLAADRIQWQRAMKLSKRRDDILSAVANRLRDFAPNTISNIKHPWKLNDRHSLRAWCPLHGGRWSKLIVRADEAGHVTFDCNQGCSSSEVERFINHSTRVHVVSSADVIAPATIGRTDDAAGVLYDARDRFRRTEESFKPGAA